MKVKGAYELTNPILSDPKIAGLINMERLNMLHCNRSSKAIRMVPSYRSDPIILDTQVTIRPKILTKRFNKRGHFLIKCFNKRPKIKGKPFNKRPRFSLLLPINVAVTGVFGTVEVEANPNEEGQQDYLKPRELKIEGSKLLDIVNCKKL